MINLIQCLIGEYGGDYSDCGLADYLFGVDLNDEDIDQVYYNSFGITVFSSDWILEVIKSRKEIEDVPISPFLLLPQYTNTKSVDTKPPKMLTPHALYKKKSAVTNNEAPTTTMTERPHATGISKKHKNMYMYKCTCVRLYIVVLPNRVTSLQGHHW